MLFYLSEELLSREYTPERQVVIKRAIEYIIKSVWESKHLVHADFDMISMLEDEIEDLDCLQVLRNIRNNYAFLNYDIIKFYIELVPEEDVLEIVNSNGSRILRLSVDYVQKSDITQRVIILCENSSDAHFFNEICKYYINDNQFGNISLQYEAGNGGGTDIDVQFSGYVDRKDKFCLAFGDSDKHYPLAQIGGTLKKLLDVDKCNNYLCNCFSLEAHEIENLVPFNYLDDIKDNTIQINGLNFIKKIVDSDNSVFLKYYDIKKGVLKKHTTDAGYLEFVKPVVPYCTDEDVDFYIDSKEDNQSIIPATGKVMNLLLKNLDIFNTKVPELLDYQKDEWKKIGQEFLFWTCARNEEALN